MTEAEQAFARVEALDLDELERLAKAATWGEWFAPEPDDNPSAIKSSQPNRDVYVADAMEPDDQAFIAAANPATVLRLLSLARQAGEMREALEFMQAYRTMTSGARHERWTAWAQNERDTEHDGLPSLWASIASAALPAVGGGNE